MDYLVLATSSRVPRPPLDQFSTNFRPNLNQSMDGGCLTLQDCTASETHSRRIVPHDEPRKSTRRVNVRPTDAGARGAELLSSSSELTEAMLFFTSCFLTSIEKADKPANGPRNESALDHCKAMASSSVIFSPTCAERVPRRPSDGANGSCARTDQPILL